MTWHPAAWQQCTNRRNNLAAQVESGGRSTTACLMRYVHRRILPLAGDTDSEAMPWQAFHFATWGSTV
jgi:hypothetical protein